ncbi:MAG: ABC transporter ATP-binding protein [Calditrichaeota bacterium]|nr:MAG: ABC transporter ATP-binding protein [Calditrichota bacterium]
MGKSEKSRSKKEKKRKKRMKQQQAVAQSRAQVQVKAADKPAKPAPKAEEDFQPEWQKNWKESNRISYKSLFRIYKLFGRHYKKYWKQLAIAYTGLLIAIVLAMLAPWPLKLILDYVILKNPLPEKFAFIYKFIPNKPEVLLIVLASAYFVIRIVHSFVTYLHKVGAAIAGGMMVADFRERVFAHLQRLSLSFHQTSHSGDIIYRLTSDITQLNVIIVKVPQYFVNRTLMIGAHLSLMLMLEWHLALVAFSVIPFIYYFNRRFGIGIQNATRKKRKKESKVSSIVAENVTAMALVQAYGREDLQQKRFETENQASLKSGIRAMRLSKLFKRVNELLIAIGTGSVVFYGSKLAMDGVILPGTVVLFASYLRSLYGPLDKFAEMFLNIAKSQVACDRLLEVMECDMVLTDSPDAIEAPPFKGKIEFRDVTFAYKKNVDVLKNVSFVVNPGESVAVLGHSGAGKSTLVSLIMRFYDPQSGQVLIDDLDIRKLKLRSLRDQITILLQEAKLFNMSVRENIRFGKAGATDEEVEAAAKLAQAHDFIMEMPNGYDTVIYEGGENLSGGQMQRINVARAIIRNTPIVILDEPATALDTRAETKVNEAIRALTRNKTTFIIAHKFSTIATADRILLLKEGELVAFGTHQQLIHSSQEYRELFELQFGVLPEAEVKSLEKVN